MRLESVFDELAISTWGLVGTVRDHLAGQAAVKYDAGSCSWVRFEVAGAWQEGWGAPAAGALPEWLQRICHSSRSRRSRLRLPVWLPEAEACTAIRRQGLHPDVFRSSLWQ